MATYVAFSSNKNENGFKLWSWSGQEQFSMMKSPLHQFTWRPRPPSLLSKDQTKWLANPENFKTYQEKYRAAVPYLEKVIADKPNDVQIWELLGQVYANLGELEKANTAYKKADDIRQGKN